MLSVVLPRGLSFIAGFCGKVSEDARSEII